MGVHQLVHGTKKLHNPQHQQQQQQPGEEKQQLQQVPVVPGDLARGIAGRPMKETPALIGAQRAHVECNVPVDDSLVAYWNDPVGTRDANFNTVFNSQQRQQQQQQETPPQKQYITFSPDPGGWNNVSMIFSIHVCAAAAIVFSLGSRLRCLTLSCWLM
jgi:hypothetical protein